MFVAILDQVPDDNFYLKGQKINQKVIDQFNKRVCLCFCQV